MVSILGPHVTTASTSQSRRESEVGELYKVLSSKLHVGIVMDGNGRWALGRGGEKRLSDFLLWESAYAELRFTETMWPDFGAEHLAEAVTSFRGRERRFGGLSTCAAAA